MIFCVIGVLQISLFFSWLFFFQILLRHCYVSQASTTFQLILFLTLTENSEGIWANSFTEETWEILIEAQFFRLDQRHLRRRDLLPCVRGGGGRRGGVGGDSERAGKLILFS